PIRTGDREQRCGGPSGLVELRAPDLEPLRVYPARLGGEHVAADVRGVARGGEDGDALRAAEDRRGDRDVVEVPGGEPGVVRDQDVARPERLWRARREGVLHGERHGGDVTRRA